MDRAALETCRILDWDTQFFGMRIAQAIVPFRSDETAQAVLEWCRTTRIACLYYLVPCGDIQSISLAEKSGFHLVDIRLTFELGHRGGIPPTASSQIRPSQPGDIPALREIARQVYRNTRFFNDGNFPVHLCKELYMTWIEKSCQGYADMVWVASPENDPVGFITCHLENGSGQIGLLGIHPNNHHQGWGKQLVRSALEWFGEQHCTSIKVVTQGNNYAAQKLYGQCGFHLASVELWYHRWFDTAPQESHS